MKEWPFKRIKASNRYTQHAHKLSVRSMNGEILFWTDYNISELRYDKAQIVTESSLFNPKRFNSFI